MAYTTSEARRELLDTVAQAANELGFASACLAEAYERLDDYNGDESGLKSSAIVVPQGRPPAARHAVAQSVRCPEQRLGALIGAVDPVHRAADEHHHPDGPAREHPGARQTRWDQAREGLGPGRLHRAATVQRLHTRP
jgi:hypothetical protein